MKLMRSLIIMSAYKLLPALDIRYNTPFAFAARKDRS
jgi:hypothetical protein